MIDVAHNRVAVITGASSGIGKAAAKAMAASGWRIIALGRNPQRCAAALAEIRLHAPDAVVDMIQVDLALMSDVQRAAREIIAKTDRIDVLLNNAGGMGQARVVTAEGNEQIFAGNHLGHFLLTRELLPLLKKASFFQEPGSVRVVNVSSLATAYSPGLNWDDLQMLQDHNPGLAYCNVKIANQMFTRALAKKLEQDGIRVTAMHPGVADTNFSSHGEEEAQKVAAESNKDVIVSADHAADTLIWLATNATAGLPGSYYHDRKPYEMHPQALDDAEVERLWSESELIVSRSAP